MKHVVMFSGGAGSWAAAKRVAKQYGTADMILLFADTLMEDEDLYRFIDQASVNVGAKLIKIAEGRTPWQVFNDNSTMPNHIFDLCSRILKREFIDKWLSLNCDKNETICYVGFDWSESHRFERLVPIKNAMGWTYKAPLCEPPYLSRSSIFHWMRTEGITPPRLYELGMPHNNCGGFCIKAGQAQFANLLRNMPERYSFHENEEKKLRNKLGKNLAILKETKNGQTIPLTLQRLRERLECNGNYDLFDFGGCGCFTDEMDAVV